MSSTISSTWSDHPESVITKRAFCLVQRRTRSDKSLPTIRELSIRSLALHYSDSRDLSSTFTLHILSEAERLVPSVWCDLKFDFVRSRSELRRFTNIRNVGTIVSVQNASVSRRFGTGRSTPRRFWAGRIGSATIRCRTSRCKKFRCVDISV